MEQPEARRQEDAWRRLYRLWGISALDAQNGCAQAHAHSLDCLRGEGGLAQLAGIDRPAIVRVADAQGAPRWLVIERLQDGLVTFAAGGARTVVGIDKLDGYGLAEFALLWRPPAGTRGILSAGDRGPGVAWLVRRLAAAGALASTVRPDRVYDAAVVKGVRSFQRSRGLEPDGIAGPKTLILLDRDPAPWTPTLVAEG